MANQLDLSAPELNLKVQCGKDWTFTVKKSVDGVYKDFSGYTFIGLQIRRIPDDTVIYTLNAGTGITVQTTSIILNLPGQQTATIPPGIYQYDLLVVNSGIYDMVIRGQIEFIAAITLTS